jgi:hypothetical protein
MNEKTRFILLVLLLAASLALLIGANWLASQVAIK